MRLPLLFGAYGSGALKHAAALADFNANACWFHGFNAAAFEACEAHGLAACVEFKTFRADFGGAEVFRDAERARTFASAVERMRGCAA